MQMTRMPAFTRSSIRHLVLPAVFRTAPVLGALLLAVLPASAQGQSLNNNNLRLAEPLTVIQPNVRLAMPALNPNPTVLRTLVQSTARIAPNLAPTTKPAIGETRFAPTAATTGLGRLVAPGNEGASVVVGRIGSTTRSDVPSLTVDFDGDGLINFEIAPGIIDVPAGAADRGGDALGGLVGQNIALATDAADRVLDRVINIEGVVPATTFEIANGTVVLGGVRAAGIAGQVEDLPMPHGPPTHKPNDTDPHDPAAGTVPDDVAGNPSGGGGTDAPGGICRYIRCPPEDPPARPGNGPNLDDFFQFAGPMTPPTPDSDQGTSPDDLIDVSIMLPLRGRERQGDQFSNYGNEEIW